ncbi:DNA cytosine methyltransferase [Bacillus mojavensis]|uniref:DNA cytosine methyltransferase n=1 Tax=Bacillus mojavensis TaxID=72360 RepID=UPI002DB6B102|nr:DNA (cytosine-5-)-methyltransferase [Bacillus mojavensis]MEC1683835.1 DNA (cytosine-5-)-methyltransferase [Bacillus mojavensis]MEC1707616.1 DNA (cytosine-5-)-methyltransferase [Bacillus mojavensis]
MKVVSLFSGCGGSDLGVTGGFEFIGNKYKKLPFEIVFANDVDRKALNTYEANFESEHVVCNDIREIPSTDIPEHDLLIGGFPCQSFSTVNPTKDPFDERANLYKEMVRVLQYKQPKFFIAENVKGFMTLKKGTIFKRVCEEFNKCGYNLSADLLNAADYGVPQKRQRVFIVGIRKDLGKNFLFPKPTHSENGEGNTKEWEPLKKVIDSLVPDDPKYYFSERAVQGMKNAKKNMKRGLWQDLNGPCLTITSHLAKVSLNSRDPVLLVDPEKELYRRFSPREAARIQSFPDSFEFVGSQGDAYRQIGNAIPPVMMWQLTNALTEQFVNVKKENDQEIQFNVKDNQFELAL